MSENNTREQEDLHSKLRQALSTVDELIVASRRGSYVLEELNENTTEMIEQIAILENSNKKPIKKPLLSLSTIGAGTGALVGGIVGAHLGTLGGPIGIVVGAGVGAGLGTLASSKKT
ncbi:hypothetical protein Mgra_00003750 [Meloidogyne graminicola]|uniref:Glycine zipper domain-containing protein n=1 Tax=Meloidogyne graminicola TaxID=189291 RepID=A0A8S9ZU53_9BILA|nr:hypothetical protein Mgra_00003750 [Meloidogyne graminicola]